MPLKDALKKSEQWMIHCASLVDGISFPTTNRVRVAISLHHLCIEHQTGIHTLVDSRVFGSAFALFRPQMEAYIRGAWYHLCAEDPQITKFLNGAEPPKMDILIQQLETKDAFQKGTLRRMKEEVWRNLCDFTHGGSIQVKARNTRDEVIPNYKPEHIAGLLTCSATLSMLAGVGIAAATDLDSLAERLRDAYYRIYGERA